MRSPKLTASFAGIVVAAAIACFPAPAAAATSCDRVASPSGSDAASGTLASPYRSATKLADSLAPGQTGCFRAGKYGSATLEIDTPSITLAPYGSEAVTLGDHIKLRPSAANVVIEGMTLDASASSDNSAGPKIYAPGVVLRDNEITNRHTAICVQVGSYYDEAPPSGVVIERNRIHNCGKLPATNLEHGIYLADAVGPVVRDNWIYNNADLGIQQYPEVRGAMITGNVIFGNGKGINFSGVGSVVTRDSTVHGNIVADSTIAENAYSGGSGPNGTNNVFRDNCVHALKGGSGIESNARSFSAHDNLVASPGFVNPAAGDFRLDPASPCLAKYTGTLSGLGGAALAGDGVSAAGQVSLKVTRRSLRGRWIKLRGSVPAIQSSGPKTVRIERWHAGAWREVTGTMVKADQRFEKRMRARHGRTLRLRAVMSGAGASRMVRVRARR